MMDLPTLVGFDDLEFHYNPRVAVPEAPALLEACAARGAAARAAHPPASLRYGPHPRETIDLVVPASARATLVFIHGGYWRALSKEHFSWIAPPWAAAGVATANVEYPLCPEVTVADIAAATRRALATLLEAPARPAGPVVVAGHSAGGYLAAELLTGHWPAPPPLAGVLAISGVFDPAPLLATSINADIRLDAAAAAALNLLTRAPSVAAPLALSVGGDEPAGFQAQTEALARAWAGLAPARPALPGRNHFTAVDALAEPGSALWDWVAARIGQIGPDGGFACNMAI